MPLLFSLIAEPLTGLADTAFVARLDAAPLAGLGVGAAVLSSVFWVFNFLGIATQTQVARSHGAGDHARVGLANAQALVLSGLLGVLVALPAFAVLDPIVGWMGASGDLIAPAKDYMAIRLFGSPAVLITVAAFGTLRGLQDMRTPLWIAAGLNALNIVLDPILIFGLGPVPAFGVAGRGGGQRGQSVAGSTGCDRSHVAPNPMAVAVAPQGVRRAAAHRTGIVYPHRLTERLLAAHDTRGHRGRSRLRRGPPGNPPSVGLHRLVSRCVRDHGTEPGCVLPRGGEPSRMPPRGASGLRVELRRGAGSCCRDDRRRERRGRRVAAGDVLCAVLAGVVDLGARANRSTRWHSARTESIGVPATFGICAMRLRFRR